MPHALLLGVGAFPLSRRSKLRLWRYRLRRMIWDRRDLLGELSYTQGTRSAP